ncbi:MAG TPA: hypothetical protein QKA14_01855 [Candidatus Megaira endosymbiont of Hartmannula sinica]|nr:hypothetical protein [Candidatus Megaera endosymbiont of Hartmannula sinica]
MDNLVKGIINSQNKNINILTKSEVIGLHKQHISRENIKFDEKNKDDFIWTIKVVDNTTKIEYNNNEENSLCSTNNKIITYNNFDWVISCTPPKLMFHILPKYVSYRKYISNIKMSPCFTLSLTITDENSMLDLGWDCALVKGAKISWISFNNSKPLRNKLGQSVVLVSSNRWASNNISLSISEAKKILLQDFYKVIKLSKNQINNIKYETTYLKKWFFTNIKKRNAENFIICDKYKIASAGDFFIQGRAESAFKSANSLGNHLIDNYNL